jgi:hypothetical protein
MSMTWPFHCSRFFGVRPSALAQRHPILAGRPFDAQAQGFVARQGDDFRRDAVARSSTIR